MFSTLMRHRRTTPDTLRLKVEGGDVAGIVTADLQIPRSIDADRAELTRIIEAEHARGAIDRATGGHLLDAIVEAWHMEQMSDLKRSHLARAVTADRLVGAAEAEHARTREALGIAAENFERYMQIARCAATELVGSIPSVALPHQEWLARAAARDLAHGAECGPLTGHVPPWHADGSSTPDRTGA